MMGKNGLVLLFGIFLALFSEESASECKQSTACSCMFSNGQALDLLPLNNSRPLTAMDSNYTFHFHPCSNAPLSEYNTTECRGVSLCMEHQGHSFSLGTANETSITADVDSSKTPQLTLRHGKNRTSIALVCCNICTRTTMLVDSMEADSGEYYLTVVSPYACKTLPATKDLSTGSIMLIYFFVITGIYFIGGAITLKLLRGATGWEMLPNHKFWRELPSLVKDGVVFTFSCCRATSYDAI